MPATHTMHHDSSPAERTIVLFMRLAMAWTFLYAASHQVFDPHFSVAAFLKGTKTFHGLYAPFTDPRISPVLTFLVGYGHLLIGLSLLVGLAVRVSAPFGIALLLLYWTAHMDFPYIENKNNLLLDYHIVYSAVLVYLVIKKAGRVWGLDGWLETLPLAPKLRMLVS
jgi:thiosulfate dehydrogenase [quinone] large subunit